MAEATKGINIQIGATDTPEPPGPVDGPDGPDGLDDIESNDWSAWRNLWQIPSIGLSLTLIVVGLVVASRRAPVNDFDGVLREIQQRILIGEYDVAREQIETIIEPNISLMSPIQVGKYNATLADWVALTQDAATVRARENNELIATQYAEAVTRNYALSLAQIERWAMAQIDLGQFDGAERRLTDLEAMALTDALADEARARRNRVLRRLVEVSLLVDDMPYDKVMSALERFRQDAILAPADRAWVTAQQARLRIEAGNVVEAVDRLLVDMRRFELDELPPEPWGELYMLLGRGYYEQGKYEHAEYYLEEARRRLSGAERVFGDTLLMSGLIAKAQGDFDTAFERFDEVVRDFADTDALLPAQFARAEIQSIDGDHEDALTDFRAIAKTLLSQGPRPGLNRSLLASTLADRHDAALTLGDLPLALEYVSLAEGLFDRAEIPIDVLFRLASTTRQTADNIMSEARRAVGRPKPKDADLSPELRHEASKNYERAAEYFLLHARALAAVSDGDAAWADSLWLTGDSYDLAGLRREAITYFLEYVAGRSIDDPRRAETTFRLAQAYEADRDFDAAARVYEQAIEEHPRSTYGTASHVPLARCYVALDRARDAEDQLQRVVDGRQGDEQLMTPDAVDYRDALVELGRLYYEAGDIPAAIERLTATIERYPDDPRIEQVRFRLADSHQKLAKTIRKDLQTQARVAPAHAQTRQTQTREAFEQALALFGRVYAAYAQRESLDRLENELQRYAALYRADCAYELERYELAEQFYDEAARRYSDHHASMHALVQIVNCFERLGDTQAADIAHRNAILRLKQLPDTAFDDPESLMDRAAWEQWLMNRPVGLAQGEVIPK